MYFYFPFLTFTIYIYSCILIDILLYIVEVALNIHSVQKLSLIDFNGHLSAIAFCSGCNMRCPYCHNPSIAKASIVSGNYDQEYIFSHLKKRKAMIDCLVISGGEALLQKDLPDFCKRIKDSFDIKIKIDTNGSLPKELKRLLETKTIDYVACDIKARPKDYPYVVGLKNFDINLVLESIDCTMNFADDYEFRSTLFHPWHNAQAMEEMAKLIKGAKLYYLQEFRNTTKLIDARGLCALSTEDMNTLKNIAEKYVDKCLIRKG